MRIMISALSNETIFMTKPISHENHDCGLSHDDHEEDHRQDIVAGSAVPMRMRGSVEKPSWETAWVMRMKRMTTLYSGIIMRKDHEY